MEPISSRQNFPHNIQKLEAQRYLYSFAKRLSALRLGLAGCLFIVGAIAFGYSQEAKPLVAFAGILVSFLNIGWLERWQKSKQREAADIQELFDCEVLGIARNSIFAQNQPNVEDIVEAARKDKQGNNSPLENWYPTIIDSVNILQARVICQRINCQWDSNIRRQYARILWTVFTLVVAIMFFLGLFIDMDMQTFVLAIVAPLTPFLLWGMREAQWQREAAFTINQLKDVADVLWKNILENDLTEDQATSRSGCTSDF